MFKKPFCISFLILLFSLHFENVNANTYSNTSFLKVSSLNSSNFILLFQIKDSVQNTEKQLSGLSNLIIPFSMASIVVLTLLVISLYKNSNIRLKANNMLHKKNEELTNAMEQAKIASKAKANFLSTVTHELRTPLYAVTGLTNMLLEENPKLDQIPHLKSLKFSAEYLLTFINDILQINKIEAQKVDMEPEVFNLKKRVKDVISALNHSAKSNNTKLHYIYDNSLPEYFENDQIKISQILINLIGNSIKFTTDGDIWIKVSKLSESGNDVTVRFVIKDTGIGIGEEKQKNIFDSFSQGSIQINRKYGGTGLGLSIVKGLVDILNGKIYLNSEIGKGSTFCFEVPLKSSVKSHIEKKQFVSNFTDTELRAIKILVVEDNKINQMITKKILSKMKLNCDITETGEEALRILNQKKFDAILMDIHMPGISGLETTRIIRKSNTAIPIFALTAVTIEDKMEEFNDVGFTGIIPKPFKQEDFEEKLFLALSNFRS